MPILFNRRKLEKCAMSLTASHPALEVIRTSLDKLCTCCYRSPAKDSVTLQRTEIWRTTHTVLDQSNINRIEIIAMQVEELSKVGTGRKAIFFVAGSKRLAAVGHVSIRTLVCDASRSVLGKNVYAAPGRQKYTFWSKFVFKKSVRTRIIRSTRGDEFHNAPTSKGED